MTVVVAVRPAIGGGREGVEDLQAQIVEPMRAKK